MAKWENSANNPLKMPLRNQEPGRRNVVHSRTPPNQTPNNRKIAHPNERLNMSLQYDALTLQDL